MTDSTRTFCNMIRQRSRENREAMDCLASSPFLALSPAISVLRQELDSMVRVIFLLSLRDLTERERLVRSTLAGEKWGFSTKKGKTCEVTDRDMVDISQQLVGWTKSVYKFGCAFIHLSNYHNHLCENPVEKLPTEEKSDILNHMRYYHGGPKNDSPSIEELAYYIPMVFEKIASNLECYIGYLEQDRTLDGD